MRKFGWSVQRIHRNYALTCVTIFSVDPQRLLTSAPSLHYADEYVGQVFVALVPTLHGIAATRPFKRDS